VVVQGLGSAAASRVTLLPRAWSSGHVRFRPRRTFRPGPSLPRCQGCWGKGGQRATGHGNRDLARVLGKSVVSAGRSGTFPGERCHRIARRCGKKKAIVEAGWTILAVAWHLLRWGSPRLWSVATGCK